MLAITIMAVVSGIVFLAFYVATAAWKKGLKLSDNLQHSDFVMEQLVMGLRSAYFPDTGQEAPLYGFQLEDGGEGAGVSDMISWVKLGSALVGRDCPFVGSPHRIEFSVADDDKDRPAAAIRAWRLQGQAEDFDPSTEPLDFIATRVEGFNCRVAYEEKDGEIDWLDDWEYTNKLPKLVEVTLYLEPVAEGEQAVAVSRVVTVPTGGLCWP